MINDYTVTVQTRRKNETEIVNQHFTLPAYCHELKTALMRTLQDVENCLIDLEQESDKSMWSDDTKESFAMIRRNLLNVANSIERLPFGMSYHGKPIGSMSSDEFQAVATNNI